MFFYRFAWEKNVFNSPLAPDKAKAALAAVFTGEQGYTGRVADNGGFVFSANPQGTNLFNPRIKGRIREGGLKGSEVTMSVRNSVGAAFISFAGPALIIGLGYSAFAGETVSVVKAVSAFSLLLSFIAGSFYFLMCGKENDNARRAEIFLRETLKAEVPEDWRR